MNQPKQEETSLDENGKGERNVFTSNLFVCLTTMNQQTQFDSCLDVFLLVFESNFL